MTYNERLSIRLDVELRHLLDRVCKNRREGKSCFIRQAVLVRMGTLGFLSREEIKALGMTSTES